MPPPPPSSASPPSPVQPIDAVLLDVGGVLTSPVHGLYQPALSDAGLAVDDEMLIRGHYAGIVATEDADEFTWADYFVGLARCCGAEPAAAPALALELARAWQRPGVWRRILPGAAEGLARLASTGAALAMVSNSDGGAEESLRATGLAQVGPGPGVRVSVVIDSHLVGVEKPDPRIFGLALDVVGVGPERAVHVGDTVRYDVRGAQCAGIRALHLDPYELCPQRDDHEHVVSLDAVADLVEASRALEPS